MKVSDCDIFLLILRAAYLTDNNVESIAHHGCFSLLLLHELKESHVTLSIQAFVRLLHKKSSWENLAVELFSGSRLGLSAVQTRFSNAL